MFIASSSGSIGFRISNFEPELLPTPQLGDENVGISGMQNLKGNVTKI